MNIEASVAAILRADTAIMALCGGRIYPVIMPDTSKNPPAITYQRVSENSDSTMDGPGSFTEIRLQVDAWSVVDYAEAVNLAEAISTALNGYTGTSLGVRFYNIMRDGSQDFFEAQNLHRRSVDYKIQCAV